MIVLAYLGAVANEFICSEWEGKGMHTDVYSYVWCNMGPEAHVLHSPATISF